MLMVFVILARRYLFLFDGQQWRRDLLPVSYVGPYRFHHQALPSNALDKNWTSSTTTNTVQRHIIDTAS